MGTRQRRSDGATADAVARGINISVVRNNALARDYMEYKLVPGHVISRVLNLPQSRRKPSAGQKTSEALTPSVQHSQTDE